MDLINHRVYPPLCDSPMDLHREGELSQKTLWSALQGPQSPQKIHGKTITRSPSFRPLAPRFLAALWPTEKRTPAISCPSMNGKKTGNLLSLFLAGCCSFGHNIRVSKTYHQFMDGRFSSVPRLYFGSRSSEIAW